MEISAPRDFSEAMTMSGSKVELFEIEGGQIENIVVGQSSRYTEKHPDADKLTVCQVMSVRRTYQIVTAATNLKVERLCSCLQG